MRILFIFLFSLITIFANATHYFYSTSGANTNNGTSTSTPKQTLADFNTHTWVAGDTISFKSGDVFTGSMLLSQSGTSLNHIVLNSYGTGNQPVISGFSPVTSWTSDGNGIYFSNAFSPTTDIKMVYLNGHPAVRGRYPNDDASNGGYLTFEAHVNGSPTSTITDNSIGTTPLDATWDGASVELRTTHSNLENGVITDINTSTGVITYNSTQMGSQVTNNWGYFISNSKKTLDKFGEWWYDPSSKRIYMYFGSSNPDLNDVKATTIDLLLEPRGNFITIRNIDFTGANNYAISNNWGNINTLDVISCNLTFIGVNAIALNGRVNFTMDSCVVAECGTNGVEVGYHCTNATVKNTTIKNIALIPSNYYSDGNYQRRIGYGIFSGAALGIGLTAINDKIMNIGYSGMFLDTYNNFIYKNYVNSACMILDDGGGIYTGNFIDTVQTNNIIRRNIVLNIKGAPLGADGHNMAVGIYIDDNSNNFIVDSNFVSTCGQFGTFFHNTWQGKIRANTLFDNSLGELAGQDDNINHQIGEIAGMVISRNILFNKVSTEYDYYLQSAQNNFTTWGIIDTNTVCNPFNESGDIAHLNAFNTGITNYTFATWRSTLSHDLHGTQTPLTISKVYNILTDYAVDNPSTIHFFGTYKTMDGVSHTSNITLNDYTGTILAK